MLDPSRIRQYRRLERAWDRAWTRQASLGRVDDLGGAEYRRRLDAWRQAGRPVDVLAWIVPPRAGQIDESGPSADG